jgi:hypothetical protein
MISLCYAVFSLYFHADNNANASITVFNAVALSFILHTFDVGLSSSSFAYVWSTSITYRLDYVTFSVLCFQFYNNRYSWDLLAQWLALSLLLRCASINSDRPTAADNYNVSCGFAAAGGF